MNIYAKKADVTSDGLQDGNQGQPEPKQNDSRTDVVDPKTLQGELSNAGRLRIAQEKIDAQNAKIKSLEAEKEATRVKELEEKQQYKELYEAIQQEKAQREATYAEKDAELEQLRSFKQKQIEESINDLMKNIPVEEHAEHMEMIEGMSFDKKKKYLTRIAGTIRKPANTPLTGPSHDGVKNKVDQLFDAMNEKK